MADLHRLPPNPRLVETNDNRIDLRGSDLDRHVHPENYPPSIYDNPLDLARIEALTKDIERDLRYFRIRRYVSAFCIAAAVFAIVWFGGQFIRGAL